MSRGKWAGVGALALTAVLAVAAFAGTGSAAKQAKKPIVIGAVVDLTKNMAPFDAPAVTAAQIEIKKINAKGGVLGRPLQLRFINDQLDPQKTKQGAAQFVAQKVDIGWVNCDVDYATPAAQEFLNAKKLTLPEIVGTLWNLTITCASFAPFVECAFLIA